MPIAEIQTPDGKVIEIEVPVGASEQDIINFVQSQDLSQFQNPTVSEQAAESISASPNPLSSMVGSAENIASIASSAVLEPIAGLAGLGAEGLQALGFDAPEGADVVRTVQGAAFQPITDEGKRIQQNIGQSLGAVEDFVDENITEPLGVDNLGQRTLDATGSPLAATAVETSIAALPELIPAGLIGGSLVKRSRAAKKLIADQIKKGEPNVDTVTKMLNDRGDIVTNRTSKRALDTIKKDIGDEKAAQVVSVAENMTDASKNRVNKMLDIIEESRKRPIFGQTNRPSDILGDAVADRARAVARINDRAAKNIGNAAQRNLKGKSVDVSAPANQFFNDLKELGVRVTDNDGRVNLDFSDSQFVGGGADKIERLANFVKSGEVDGLQGHRIKQFARELVDFGKGTESAVSARSQNIIKKLAAGIDGELDNISPAYRKANENFAKTIQVKEDFDKLAGKDVDIFSDISKKSLGGKARRLVSNAESRVQIEQLLNNADNTLKEFNVNFKDDIPSLSHMVTQLENMFKVEPPGSFQGRLQRAGANVAQGISPSSQAAEAVSERIFNLTKPDFDKKMKAMRALTRVKK